MKRTFYIIALIFTSLTISLSSCSVLNKSKSLIVNGSEGSTSGSRDTAEGKLAPPTEKEKKGKKNKKKQTVQGVKSQREPVKGEETSVASTVEEKVINNLVPSDFTLNGEWTIHSVRDNVLNDEERPYINLDLSQNKFYGSNGCNIINGSLRLAKPDSICMDNMISTMKLCQDAQYEYLINLAVSDVRTYGVRQEGTVTFLDLKNESGKTILVLRRHNMDFLNGAWKVEKLNGTAPNEEVQPSMTINTTDLKLHGTTGCNIFNGTIFIDPDKFDSLQFIKIATTRKACAPTSRETEFLLALESVETAKETAPDTVTLYDENGKELFLLSRITIKK